MITLAEVRRLNDRATYPNTTIAASRFMKQFAVNNSPMTQEDTHALMLIDDAIGNDEVGTLIAPMKAFPSHLVSLQCELLREYEAVHAYVIEDAGFILTGESARTTRTIAISNAGTLLFDERDSDDAIFADLTPHPRDTLLPSDARDAADSSRRRG